MNSNVPPKWVTTLTKLATEKPVRTLGFVGLLTIVSIILAEHLELRMNWTDLLPEGDRTVQLYRDVQDRFGDPSIVVALEGERDAIVAMAEDLEPRLEALDVLHNVWGKMPVDFIRDHGFVLLKPEQFDRALRSFEDWTLVGALRGLNNDYETEYTDSESNMRRDEVDVARGILGLSRALELLQATVEGERPPEAIAEAADALSIGEPWMLSLDREMLLISCTPTSTIVDIELTLETVEQVEAIIAEVGANHPDVYASTTGMAKIAQDEMNSVGFYTILLSIAALVLIFFLLARTFNGWVIPLFALTPLLAGIFWTMGALQLIYGSLNLFTAMMGLVLLGLGIDFSVHVVTRYQEERGRGRCVEDAISQMFNGTGVAVIIGGVTTSLAFFTLLVGDTQGVSEFGTASGLGVLLTLAAIFLTLPALLVLLERRRERKGTTSAVQPAESDEGHKLGYAWIGSLAAAGWKRPWLFLSVTTLLVAGSAWAIRHTAYEYDFLELEAEGLRSVELQRQIPPRFGTSDHAAWLVTESVEESRTLKEAFRRVPEVGDVSAISDYLPSEERLAEYAPKLNEFREGPLATRRIAWQTGDAEALAAEVERLWDNIDLMSNLAFTAGLDRIVNVIDEITGVDSETGETDPTALLPTLFNQMSDGVADATMLPIAEAWATRLKANLERMTNPAPVGMDDLPGNVRRSFLTRDGSEGLLLHVIPRRNLWNRVDMDRFAAQTEAVDDEVIGTEKLMIVMMDSTLADGKSAALLALGVIALLLLLYFRGPRGLLALVPLAVGTLLMLGLMYVFRMKYNYMNLIATPIILGIGIDDGVHALHRFSEQQDTGVDRVSNSFRFVGKAILLTSLTTMIGFGSVGFYEMRGMASFGLVLLMGVGTCFLATVFVLPATIRLFLREPAEEN